MNEFLLCLIPIFVAVDPVGNLPLFISLTRKMTIVQRRRIVVQSIITALVVSLAFLAVGRIVLGYLGVSVGDFTIAGGALLFIFSITDLMSHEGKEHDHDPDSVGAVPIGVPLVAGPALFTSMLIISGEYGSFLTVTATVLTLMITGIVFMLSRRINTLIGKTGAKIVSKLASLLLAAIGVMMIRKGIVMTISEILK